MLEVLVVDDEKSIRITLREFIESAGYSVKCVESAEIAMDILSEEPVDVIVTDLIMPRVSGVDLLKHVRESKLHTEVITITGEGDLNSAAEIVELGAFAFLFKPIARANFVDMVSKAMKWKKSQDHNRKLEAEKEKYYRQNLDLLEQLKGKYHKIMESIQEGYYEVDLTGKFTYVNPSLCQMLRYSAEELLGMDNRIYMNDINAKKVFDIFNRVYETGEPRQILDFNFITRDGVEQYCQISVALMEDKEKNPIGFNGIVQDITEQKLAHKKLEHSEQRFKALIDNSSVGIILVGLEGEILNVNPRLLEILGSPSIEKTMEINMFEFQPLIDAGISGAFEEVLESKKSGKYECEYTSIWGNHSNLKYHLNPVFDLEKNLIGVQGTVENITETVETLQKLQANENKFRQFYDRLPDAIFICEIGGEYSGRIIDANNAAGEQTGYAISELIGKNIITDLSKEDKAKIDVNKFEQELKAGRTIRFTENKVRKDGSRYLSEILMRAINLEGEKFALSVNRLISKKNQT